MSDEAMSAAQRAKRWVRQWSGAQAVKVQDHVARQVLIAGLEHAGYTKALAERIAAEPEIVALAIAKWDETTIDMQADTDV